MIPDLLLFTFYPVGGAWQTITLS